MNSPSMNQCGNEFLPSNKQSRNGRSGLDLQHSDISMPNPLKLNSKQATEDIIQESKRINQLQSENRQIKKRNKQLVIQLQIFSKKLDEEIAKRQPTHQVRNPRVPLKPQEKESIELQNAYKKIEIYRKEVNHLKMRCIDSDQDKFNSYENKVKFLSAENETLKGQIKSLKKIIKQQDKGLIELGADGYLKLSGDFQKCREENRKLRLEMQKLNQKQYRSNSVKLCPRIETRDSRDFDSVKKKNMELLRGKAGSNYRTKTETNAQSSMSASQIKIEKDIFDKSQQKIRVLTSEKSRQRQIIENLKIQIVQKDREANYLKEKVESLRKIIKNKKRVPKNFNKHSQQNTEEAQYERPRAEYENQIERSISPGTSIKISDSNTGRLSCRLQSSDHLKTLSEEYLQNGQLHGNIEGQSKVRHWQINDKNVEVE